MIKNVIRDLRVTTKLFEIANLSERLEPDSQQHEAILDAFYKKEADKAKSTVEAHINSLYQFALKVYNTSSISYKTNLILPQAQFVAKLPS